MTISTIILTKNNQDTLKRLITSLSWCDEIIVVDDQSVDNTVRLAKKLAAKVFIRSLNNNFAAQRNFGLTQVTADWAFFVDTDEVVTPGLAAEIKSVLNSAANGFFITRLDYFLGKKLIFGETGHINLLRLARTNTGRWYRPVHENWRIKGSVGQLKSPLYHRPHPTLAGFLDKINHYTDIEAKHRSFSLLELFFYPPAKFIHNYVFKLGILDGLPGLVMALMMSLHSLLVRLKVYEKTLARPAPHPSAR